jgi:hypothetical protein
MRTLLGKLLIWVCACGLLGLLQNRLLWGFWLHRPSLAAELRESSEILALSTFSFDEERLPVLSPNRQEDLAWYKAFCGRESDQNECLEGAMIAELERKGLIAAHTSEISTTYLREVWSGLQGSLWRARVREPRYRKTGAPARGLAIHYLTPGGEERMLLSWRTSEVANDRYAYAEALAGLKHGQPSLKRQIHFFFEVAGLEGLGWLQLTLLNLAASGLLAGSLFAIRGAQVRRRRSQEQGSA